MSNLTLPLTVPLSQKLRDAVNIALYGASSAFSPVSVFSGGKQGIFLDISDPATLFQDTGGATPVTTAGQTTQRVNDLSGNSNYAIQSTGASAPLYGIDTDGTPYIDTATARALYTAAALNLSSSDKLTVFIWLNDIGGAASAKLALELSNSASLNSGSFYLALDNNGASQGPGFLLNGGAVGAFVRGAAVPNFIGGLACRYDLAQATLANEIRPEINGAVYSWTTAFASTGSGNFASAHVLNIGARAAASTRATPINAKIYGVFVMAGDCSDTEFKNLRDWGYARYGITTLAAIGDSTVAAYSGSNSVVSYVTKAYPTNVAVAGHTIAQQKTAWEALSASVRESHKSVVVQIGLNDLDPAEAASVAIARLQDLVGTVIGDVSATCKVFVAKMIPCRARLISVYGATNGPIAYQKWLDMNEAIAGGGATPITGVYGRITAHEPLMNDGSGNLLGAYDTGDGIHPNNAGRQVNATAWRNALVSASLLKAI